MDDQQDCAICYCSLTDPRQISCGHSFCKRCLLGLKPNQLFCPLCRTAFASVDGLAATPVEQPKCFCGADAELWCDICSKVPECTGYFCSACDATEHVSRFTKGHPRFPISEKPMTYPKCPKHNKAKKSYCEDCKLVLCTACVIDSHKTHRTTSLEMLLLSAKTQLHESLTPLENRIHNIKSKRVEIQTKIEIAKNEIQTLQNQEHELEDKLKEVENAWKGLTDLIEEIQIGGLLEEPDLQSSQNKTTFQAVQRKISEFSSRFQPIMTVTCETLAKFPEFDRFQKVDQSQLTFGVNIPKTTSQQVAEIWAKALGLGKPVSWINHVGTSKFAHYFPTLEGKLSSICQGSFHATEDYPLLYNLKCEPQ